MRRLIALVGSLVLPEGALDLEARFYQGLCLVGAIIGIAVVIPVNALQALPASIDLAAAAFGTVCLVLHLLARRGHYYPNVLFGALMLTLNAVWFPNAASHGSIAFYFFAALMLPLIFFTGMWRPAAVMLVVLNVSLLFWAERWLPGLVTHFASDDDRLLDLASGWVMSAAAVVIMLGVVLAGYTRERRRLRVTVTALDESRALLSSVVNSTDDLVWLVEPVTCGFVVFNTALGEYIQRNLGVEIRPGLLPEEMMSAERAEIWRGRYRRALDEGPYTIEDAPFGDVLLLSFSAVRNGGETVGVAVFGKDITERKTAEQERERMALQLQQSQKMESLGKLAGGVAHDFNNMLAGILGYSELLLGDETDPTKRKYLEAVVHAASRSADLTRKLLAFARRGKNIVEAVDVAGIVRDSVSMLRPTFRRDVAVSVSVAVDGLWTVDGDPSQIHQLVVNLCINANEAMPDGGRLAIAGRNLELDQAAAAPLDVSPGAYVALEVRDSGVGLTDEVRARIFEPFFTTKVEGDVKGTGLGLSTVYGIVHLHQGAVTVESSPGAGACFTVYLPRGVLAPAAPAPRAVATRGSGLILVVEDEELLRSFVVEALTTLGYRSITAADGVEGVEIFREKHATLAGVLLDLKMPRMGGRDAFVEFHAIDAAVPVLVCSGFGDNAEAQGLISLGARGLLPKPYTLSELASALARLVA
ncbi:MAG: ATP-binding protein [Vicinamibacterales bacterium]